jgi:acetylornithine deacetylase/succinyl-diaminopimelate desuccinylase-like protein
VVVEARAEAVVEVRHADEVDLATVADAVDREEASAVAVEVAASQEAEAAADSREVVAAAVVALEDADVEATKRTSGLLECLALSLLSAAR